jgi:hypothetical protein
MVESYVYERNFGCDACPPVLIKRTILADLESKTQRDHIRGVGAKREEIIEFKALARRIGSLRQFEEKRVGLFGSRSRLGQVAQSIGTYAAPGNVSPARSPIRSAISRALTPGGGRGGRGIPGRGRTSRCPEGYQYGGRFTDNEFTTCGQQLFDIPGDLGETIQQIRRRANASSGSAPSARETESTPITGKPSGRSVVNPRAPQIPRVSKTTDSAARSKSEAELIKGMSNRRVEAARLVRRDGFILEPVVSAQVLRTIPDNRDMVEATYLMTARNVDEIGGQELGLLSNTGVTKLTYVLPGGSTLELEKVRALTTGERRKLGRTVNKGIKTNNSSDPAARLKFVSDETGQGIAYREKLSDGKSIQQILKGGGKAPAAQEEVVEEAAEVTSIAEAAKIIRDGGPLSSISPSILAEALTKANLFQRNKDTYATNRAGTYKMQSSKGSGDHLSAGLASEIQSHLGLKSPDIAAVGKGDKKKYLSEVAESAASGFSVDKTSKFNDLPTSQVAALMVSDILADIPARTTNSVAIMKKGDEIAAFPDIAKSELIDLSDIKVRERTSARIREFASVSGDGLYTKYYRELKDDQRRLLQQQIDELIEKAREFNFTKYRERLYRDGELSKAEKVHLNIIQKIVANRVDVLRQSRDQLMSVLGGKK